MGLLSRLNSDVQDTNNSNQVDLHVEAYRNAGFHPIPLLPNKKTPAVKRWEDPANGPHIFNENNNIGLLAGVDNLCILDIDLSKDDHVTKPLRDAVLGEIEKQLGTSLMSESGGKHQGSHVYYLLNEAITKKMQFPLSLHHIDSNSKYGIDIMCQGGYYIVAPPSTVQSQYRYVGNVDLNNLRDLIRPIQKADLLKFVESKELKTLFGLGSLSSVLHKLYQEKIVDGELIDFGLAHFLLGVLELQDDSLWHLAFEMTFGDEFDLSRTSYLLERTCERLEDGSEMVGIGSVVDKLDADLQKLLLQSMENLEIVCGVKAARPASLPSPKSKSDEFTEDVSSTDIRLSSSIFVEEDDEDVDSAVQWLVPELLPALKFIILHGPAGRGKTTAAVLLADRAIAATGRPVIYVNLEGKLGDIGEKKELLSVSKSLFRSIKTKNEFSILNRAHIDDLLGILQKINSQGEPAAMVIIDSLMAATGELNQSAVGSAIIAFNEFTSNLRCTVLLLHHNNKNDDAKGQRKMLGSATIPGAAVLTWEIQEIENCYYARKIVVSKSNLRAMPEGDEIIVGQYPQSDPVIFRSENGNEVDPVSMTQVDLCRDILLAQLIDGQEKLAGDVRAAFGEHDFKDPTISRASKQLSIVKRRVGDLSYWSIPDNTLISRLYKAGKS